MKTQDELNEDQINQLKTTYDVVGDCWVWNGLLFGNGYGRLRRYGSRSKYHMRAHIATYQYCKGEIPTGLYVCHSCDNKACVNPDHLWLGTNYDNQKDYWSKGLDQYWTPERRELMSLRVSGVGNPMYGRRGKEAPCYGRCNELHPMYGKKHTEESKRRISQTLKQRKQP